VVATCEWKCSWAAILALLIGHFGASQLGRVEKGAHLAGQGGRGLGRFERAKKIKF